MFLFGKDLRKKGKSSEIIQVWKGILGIPNLTKIQHGGLGIHIIS